MYTWLMMAVLMVGSLPASCSENLEENMRAFRHGARAIVAVRFALGGKRLISANIDGTIVMWDVQRGSRVWTVDLDAETKANDSYTISNILGMDLSPDGQVIAVSYERGKVVGNTLQGKREYRIGLLDVQSGHEQRVLLGHVGLIGRIAFSPNGKVLASESADRTARVWNVNTGEQLLSVSLKERGADIAFSPNGKFFAVAAQATFETPPQPIVGLFDAESGRLIRDFPRRKVNVGAIAFSPDGQSLAIVSDNLEGGQIDLWDLNAKEPKRTLTDHEGGITAIAFSSDGQFLASGDLQNGRGKAIIRELGSNAAPRVHKLAAGISSLRFSPDNSVLAVGTEKGEIALIRSRAAPQAALEVHPKRTG